MPRKAAAAVDSTDAPEPRRSSRIKDLPKSEPVAKKPAKPRVKKADKEKEETKDAAAEDGAQAEAKEEKPKSARGRKRKAVDEPNGEAAGTDGEAENAPPAKKAKPASKAASAKPPSKAAAAAKPASKASKPASKASAKPASTAAAKPASGAAAKPASTAAAKPASTAAAKPASTAAAKPASRASAKPASRAASRKPASKAAAPVIEGQEPAVTAAAPVEETIAEEPEAEATAMAEEIASTSTATPDLNACNTLSDSAIRSEAKVDRERSKQVKFRTLAVCGTDASNAKDSLVVAFGCTITNLLMQWVLRPLALLFAFVVYAHLFQVSGYEAFDRPEDYGLAPGKTINLRLRSADGTALGAWFVFSESFYHTLPFPPGSSTTNFSSSSLDTSTSSSTTSQHARDDRALIKQALSHSPTILFLHGNKGTRAHPLRTALYTAFTSRLGCNVLAVDYRGFGDSGGDADADVVSTASSGGFEDSPSSSADAGGNPKNAKNDNQRQRKRPPTPTGLAADAYAAWAFLRDAGAKAEDVLVLGHSLGTAVAGALGARLGRGGEAVRGVVLLAPFASTRLLMDQYALFGVLPLLRPLVWVPGLPHTNPHILNAQDITAPVLLAHADDDVDISSAHAEVLFRALVDGALHSVSPEASSAAAAASPGPVVSTSDAHTHAPRHMHPHPHLAHAPWDWRGLRAGQAARAEQQLERQQFHLQQLQQGGDVRVEVGVLRRTVIPGFGVLEEVDVAGSATVAAGGIEVEVEAEKQKQATHGCRRLALLRTHRGAHDVGRAEGVQDAVGRMFRLGCVGAGASAGA
ncbi:hypothetical protein H0H81_005946 [Sphagnurus paluster]|uniref:AB hydrolase-1 domain-containing protein n=1 Tax=Sphagnurus paluster TaxID=117069 RepID=A0A9P7K5M7_9AGAR|nr:hypothetical protein H0H81_005946 [Sphagnurus paluster]